MLRGLTRSDERTVDELHHSTQDDRTRQGRQEVQAIHHRADSIPHGGGEAAEQRPARDEHPVVVGRLAGVAEEQVLRRRSQCGRDR